MKILFVQSESESLSTELLSGYLKKNGHEVYLFFDPRLFASSIISNNYLGRVFNIQDVLLARIRDLKPDIIGFSVLTGDYQWALNTASRIKSQFDIPIIFGGIHVTSTSERVISKGCIDIICVGEGEDPLLELLNSMEDGRIDYTIKNLWFKSDGKIIRNEMRDLEQNLDKYPVLDKDLFINEIPLLRRYYTTMFSRGCCYHCTYCCNNVLKESYKGKGKYLRVRSVEHSIKELIEAEKKYNPRIYCFADDMITAYKDWFREFSIEYKRHINKPYVCYTHPKFLNEEIGRLLKESNCLWLNLGLQTASEKTRKEVLRRVENNDEIRKCADICNRLSLRFSIDHIFDIPYEGEKEYIEAMNLYTEIHPTIINTFYLTYYPMTDIIDTAIKAGILREEDRERIEEGKHFCVATFNISSKKEGKDRIKMFNSYLFAFTLIPLVPQRLMKKIIDKGYYRHFKKVPGLFILFVKALLRIKIGQIYLYTGEIKRLFFHIYRNLKLKWLYRLKSR